MNTIYRHLWIIILLSYYSFANSQITSDSIIFANGSAISSQLVPMGNPPLAIPLVRYSSDYHRFTGKVIGNQPERVDLLPLAYGVVEIEVDGSSSQATLLNSTGNFSVHVTGTGITQIIFDDTTVNTNDLQILISAHSPPQATQSVISPLAGADQHKLNIFMFKSTGAPTTISYSYSFQAIKP